MDLLFYERPYKNFWQYVNELKVPIKVPITSNPHFFLLACIRSTTSIFFQGVLHQNASYWGGLLQLKAPAAPVKLNLKLKTGSTKPTHFLFAFQNYQNLNGHLSHVQHINVIINLFCEKKIEYGAMA